MSLFSKIQRQEARGWELALCGNCIVRKGKSSVDPQCLASLRSVRVAVRRRPLWHSAAAAQVAARASVQSRGRGRARAFNTTSSMSLRRAHNFVNNSILPIFKWCLQQTATFALSEMILRWSCQPPEQSSDLAVKHLNTLDVQKQTDDIDREVKKMMRGRPKMTNTKSFYKVTSVW